MKFFSFFSAKIIAEINSEFNKNITVVENLGKKTVYVAGAEQTGGTITGMWKKAIHEIPLTGWQKGKVLLLGLGGGDVIRILKKKYSKIEITAVEIDPEMIALSGIYFNLRNSDYLTIIQSDAWDFLSENKIKYNIIVIDLFIGKYNPLKFRNGKFLKIIKNNLTPHGIAVYNCHFIPENPEEFGLFQKKAQKLYKQCRIIASFRFSRILLLSH